jgi:SAM-dependent methyltransferase
MDRVEDMRSTVADASSLPSPFEDAAAYDALFADFDFDRGFYLALARQAQGPVLEVTCGTGRILIPCLEAGVDIEGVDLFLPMLERLRAKAAARGLGPQVHHADMRSFSLSRRYALIVIPFNGFVHCLTTADQIACLTTCRAHLAPGGRLVFNTIAPLRVSAPTVEGVPVLEHEARDPATGRTVRIYDTRTLDRVAQVQHSVMAVEETDERGRVVASRASVTDMRWTWKGEMELLLRAAGYARWTLEGGFAGEPLAAESPLMLVRAWRD